ncbi:MAG: hypothetical protein RLZZ450_6767 [Pseudomonadota bacterium]|jgi:hypothetical protein
MSRPQQIDFGNYTSSAVEATEQDLASMRSTIANQERLLAYQQHDLTLLRGALDFAERRLARQRLRLVFGERREGP